jgi:hypothetical protein
VQDFAANAFDELVNLMNGRSGLDHESKVLQSDAVTGVRTILDRRVEKQEGARFTPGRTKGELVFYCKERLEIHQRHQLVVVTFRSHKIGNVNAKVAQHASKVSHQQSRAVTRRPRPSM